MATGEQAYMILSTAPVEGRISGIVDIPNAVCTLYISKEIFQGDILPGHDGPQAFVPESDVARTS